MILFISSSPHINITNYKHKMDAFFSFCLRNTFSQIICYRLNKKNNNNNTNKQIYTYKFMYILFLLLRILYT
jgi:hypothetical protein